MNNVLYMSISFVLSFVYGIVHKIPLSLQHATLAFFRKAHHSDSLPATHAHKRIVVRGKEADGFSLGGGTERVMGGSETDTQTNYLSI